MTAFRDAAGRVWDRTLSYRALGELHDRDRHHEQRRLLSDHPGHPLGPGMPLGRALRIEFFHQPSQSWRGESHLQAWERVSRWDPCAYCGRPYSGTVDHIEPKTLPVRALGGAISWINVGGACEGCNNGKNRKSLLAYLWHRSPCRVFRPGRVVGSPAISTKEAA